MVAALQPQASSSALIRHTGPLIRSVPRSEVARQASDEFSAWLQEQCDEFTDATDPSRLIRFRKHSRSDFYVRGNQLIRFDAQLDQYVPMTGDDVDLHHVVNYLQTIIERAVTEATKSQPKFVTYSRAGDNQRVKDSVDTAQFLIDCLRTTLWTKRDAQRETKLAVLRDGVFTRTYVDPAAGPLITVPQYGIATKTVRPGEFKCPHCGVQGALSWEDGGEEDGQQQQPDMQQAAPEPPSECPQCGNGPIEVRSQPILARTLMQRQGFKVPAGELRSCPIDPFEIEISDRSEGPWASPFLFWDSVVDLSDLCEEFPDWDPETKRAVGAGLGTDRMVALQCARQLELEIGNLGLPHQDERTYFARGAGRVGGQVTDKRTAIRSQRHLRRKVYARKKFDRDVWVPGLDRVIPAGVEIGNVFPNGLKSRWINGELIKVEDHNLDWEWHGYSLTVNTRGFWGNGAEQYVGIQDWLNDSVSLALTMGMMTAAGILIVDKDRFEGLIGKPGEPLQILDRGIGEPIKNSIEHIAISGDSRQIDSLINMSKEDMVGVSGERDANSGGVPGGPGMETATGVRYQDSLASAMGGTRNELRAENHGLRYEQALRLWPQVSVYPRFMRTDDGAKARWLRGLDIGHDIGVRVEPDSHQPITNLERRGNFVAARKLGWGQKGPDGKPVLGNWGEKLAGDYFNLPNDPDASSEIDTIAYRRIDAMMQACEMAQKYAAQLPPDQAKQFITLQILRAGLERDDYPLTDPRAVTPWKSDANEQLMTVYELYSRTDEYFKAPLPLKEAIEALIPLHFAAQQKDMAEMMKITSSILGPLHQPPPPDPKAPNISVKFETLPDEAKQKVLAEAGIMVSPQAFGHKALQDQRQAVIENTQNALSSPDQGTSSEVQAGAPTGAAPEPSPAPVSSVGNGSPQPPPEGAGTI
jgi:hypothetical protein